MILRFISTNFIIRAVREVAGPRGKIMIDANNGYNLNITKQILSAVVDENIYWLEEAFPRMMCYMRI
jgi:L-rhamnonate dehydratase